MCIMLKEHSVDVVLVAGGWFGRSKVEDEKITKSDFEELCKERGLSVREHSHARRARLSSQHCAGL